MPDAVAGLLGLAAVIAVAVGAWRWAHRDDDVIWVEDDGCGGGYVETWEYEEEWYEER